MLKDVLKEARNKKGLKQEDVAMLIKVSKQTYLKWENGTTEPKASQVYLLANVLGITPNEICSGKLNVRYSLEKFIYELIRAASRKETEVVSTWKHVSDHEKYFYHLNNQTEYEDLVEGRIVHDMITPPR